MRHSKYIFATPYRRNVLRLYNYFLLKIVDKLTSLEFFVSAANHQSFSVAARYLDTSPASVSRAVQQLEQRLNTRLFDRTTRKVMLTDDGRIFYERCQQILSDLEEVELALSKSQTTPRGTLRLNLT